MTSTGPPRRTLSTIPEGRIPFVVVVAPGPELLDACREATRFVGPSQLEVTDVSAAATSVAERRPFSIVIEEDLYAFDPNEFLALARDVGGEVITMPTGLGRYDLLALLIPRLKVAFQRWDSYEALF